MNITVTIERLILDGLSISQQERPLLHTAVETELTRLLAAGGLGSGLLAGGAMAYLPAQPIQLAGESDPTRLGQNIAQAVYGGIGR